jgi:hypothetical protein
MKAAADVSLLILVRLKFGAGSRRLPHSPASAPCRSGVSVERRHFEFGQRHLATRRHGKTPRQKLEPPYVGCHKAILIPLSALAFPPPLKHLGCAFNATKERN